MNTTSCCPFQGTSPEDSKLTPLAIIRLAIVYARNESDELIFNSHIIAQYLKMYMETNNLRIILNPKYGINDGLNTLVFEEIKDTDQSRYGK